MLVDLVFRYEDDNRGWGLTLSTNLNDWETEEFDRYFC